jgi:hypothetical protein
LGPGIAEPSARTRVARPRSEKRRRGDANVPLCSSDGRCHLARHRRCPGTFIGRGCSFGWCRGRAADPAFRRPRFGAPRFNVPRFSGPRFSRPRFSHVTHDAASKSRTIVCGARHTGFRTFIAVLSRQYLECGATAIATERFGFPGRSIANRSTRAAGSRRRSPLDPVRDWRDDEQQPGTVAGFTERVCPEHSRRRWQNAASLYEFLGTGHAHEQDRVAGRMQSHNARLSERALTDSVTASISSLSHTEVAS